MNIDCRNMYIKSGNMHEYFKQKLTGNWNEYVFLEFKVKIRSWNIKLRKNIPPPPLYENLPFGNVPRDGRSNKKIAPILLVF